ncbi:MAG: SusC/RagA family TonB-linked outer membrane protein [Rhodothermales bacterium]
MFFRFLALSLLLISSTAAAQSTGTLTGQVIEAATGDPLPGVNVVITSLTQGAATDVDGNYIIPDIPEGTYEVVARFVGYGDERVTVDVQAGEETTQDFELGEDLLMMDELVVTGTGGSVERRKLSADVAVLNSRDIEEAPVTSVDQLLQGRVAGANVRLQSAQPGQAGLVNLRGITSIYGSQTPVIYIDGVRVDNASGTSLSGGGEMTSALADLITSDIDRIEVTKGGAASTLYGSDAANGVIQIFTKQGNIGAPTITLRTEQGIDTPVTQFLNDTGFAFGQTEDDPVNDAESADFGQGNFIADNFLKNGYFQNYYAGVSGGNEGLRYNVSGRVQNATGVQPSNENTVYALRGNIQADVRPDLSVGFSGSYTRNNFSRIYNGTSIADPVTSFEVGDAYFFTGTNTFEDALALFLFPRRVEGVNRYIFSTTVEYRPSPLFSTRLTAGVDSRDNEQRIIDPAEADILTGNEDGALTRFDRNYNGITLEYLSTVSYPREGTVTSDFTFGVQGFREDISIITATGETLLPGTQDFGETGAISADETRSEVFNGGFILKERLGLFDRIFLDLGLRLDGNSAFGGDVGLQSYPSFGVAYTLSDEPFWAETFGGAWDQLKLRASYGQTGKFPEPFAQDFTFSGTGFRGEASARFSNVGNEDLRPERTTTLEGGLDLAILNGRLGAGFTYYTATTTDALLFVPEQPATGQGRQLRNFGEIQNQGVELSIDAQLLNRRSANWSVAFNYSWFRNEVTEIREAPPFDIGGTTSYGALKWVTEGEPAGVWRARTPIDTNGDGLPDGVEFQITGDTPYPTTSGSLSTTLSLFRRVSLYALADWSLGAKVLDYGSVWSAFNGIPRTEAPTRYDLEGNEDGTFGFTSSRGAGSFLLKDGDFLKLREVSVRYRLPRPYAERFNLQTASVFVTGRNLLTFTRDLGNALLDPELSGFNDSDGLLELGGEQSITLPAPRQFRLGLEVQF